MFRSTRATLNTERPLDRLDQYMAQMLALMGSECATMATPTPINVCAVEVRVWMGNYTTIFHMDVITYPCHILDAGLANLRQ